MDNLTHTLIGVALARAGLARRCGRGTTLCLALASNLPDIDALFYAAPVDDPILHRRCLTHSLILVPLFAAGLAAALRWTRDPPPWRRLYGLSLLGALLHVFFDVVNSFGVVLAFPLTRTRYELAWLFIIDLALWALLLLPWLLLLVPALRRRSETLFRASLAGVALYLALCAGGRARAGVLLERAAGPTPAEFRYVFPEALGPHRFRGVLRRGEQYELWLLHVFQGRAELVLETRTDAAHPAVRALRESERGRALEWFFKAPVWRRDPETGTVEAYDLRFRSTVLGERRMPFVYRFGPELTAPGS